MEMPGVHDIPGSVAMCGREVFPVARRKSLSWGEEGRPGLAPARVGVVGQG